MNLINPLKKVSLLKAALFIIIGLSYNYLQAGESDPIAPGCDFYGTVVDYSSVGGCGYVIVLDSGYVINPVEMDSTIVFYDSMRVKVGFVLLDTTTDCLYADPVAITCFEEVGDTTGGCQAYFEYYPLDYALENALNTGDSGFSPIPMNYYQFYDISVGEVKERQWLMNDSVFSTEPDPVLHLPGQGVYEICLQIVTSSGCESEYCETIAIDTVPDECKAMFRYTEMYPPIDCGDTIVTDSGIVVPDCIPDDSSNFYRNWIQFYDYSVGNIEYWYWNFGDGTTSNEQNPLHEYPGPGVYNVCLTIYSYVSSESDSCTDTYCTTVFIDSINYDCEAYFEYCTYNMPGDTLYQVNHTGQNDTLPWSKSLIIGFKNMSRPDYAYYFWDFGDGHYSYDKNPVHQYDAPGMYNVCLTIYSELGCSSTYCKEINVGGMECDVEFTYDILVPNCEGFNIAHAFMAPATDNISFYYWDFGDGQYSWEENPIHIYEHYGTYNACLEVMFGNGCLARSCQNIVVEQNVIDTVFHAKCGMSPVRDLEFTESIGVEKVYPQPAAGQVNFVIQSDRNQYIQVSFYNLLGQKFDMASDIYVHEGKNEVPIQLDGFNTGVYLYSVNSQNGTFTGRLTIAE